MASTPRQADALREQVSRAIRRTTDLIADLKVLADGLETLLPDDTERTQTERWREVARLAGLTSADNGAHWLAHQRARLAAGEDAAAA